eukprot:TRINITY_DN2185_c0_g2_i1.p1 TRINITY_DN2185_c0_g2~~TRINITY_DN2185_c0_g2_i1.p1  ORF type:complete len:698 (+),score=212.34 TRINITY_DN2185_c0_g2_i1:69-2096(+)
MLPTRCGAALLLLAAAAAAGDDKRVDCGGGARSINCYNCPIHLGPNASPQARRDACAGECIWNTALLRCLKRKPGDPPPSAVVVPAPSAPAAPAPSGRSSARKKGKQLLSGGSRSSSPPPRSGPPPAASGLSMELAPADMEGDSGVLAARIESARVRIEKLKLVLKRMQEKRRLVAPSPHQAAATGGSSRAAASTSSRSSGAGRSAPSGGRSAAGPPARAAPGREATYLLVGFIEQQLASATSLGLHQVLRTAVALNRTAVLPRVRFDEPSYRTTLQEGYFDIKKFYDRDAMLRPWRCAELSSYGHFLRESARMREAGRIRHEIDILIELDPKRDPALGVKRNCNPDLLKEINNAKKREQFRRGVDKSTKVIDTIGGVVRVGDVVCVPQKATAEQLRKAFAGARAVMLMTPDDHFLVTPWDQVCRYGIPNAVRFQPPIAAEWVALGSRLAQQKFGGQPFACVHVRMEKLVRHAYLAKKIEWQWKDEERVEAPYLDRCVRNIQQVVSRATREAKLGSSARHFLITDTQSEYGSVTEHVDTKEDLLAYRAWLPAADKALHRSGDGGFCGSKLHRSLVDEEARHPRGGPVGILLANPRACAWAEATICRRASVILRFGGGSFSNFATAERGSVFENCVAAEYGATRKGPILPAPPPPPAQRPGSGGGGAALVRDRDGE